MASPVPMLPVPRISALAPDTAKIGWVVRRGEGLVTSRQPMASSVAAMVVETRANNGVRWKGYICRLSIEKTELPGAKATPFGLTRIEIRRARRTRDGSSTAHKHRHLFRLC